MSRKIRWLVQTLFLVFFIVLTAVGKIQVWMAVFFGSVIAAAIFGRFYCGWVCPINTITEKVDSLAKKLDVKRKGVPEWIKKPAVRYIVLIIFIGTMAFMLVSGRKFPVLIVLAFAGVILSVFFVPALWHRYLCPYGTILGFTGSLARLWHKVDEQECSRCGMCKDVCPAEAIDMRSKDVYPQIKPALCLECGVCGKACPKNAIRYF